MAFDFQKLLTDIGSQLAQNAFKQNPQTGSFNIFGVPQQAIGAGLFGAGLAQKDEPGSVTEARQFLRNRFTSPTALSQQFTGQVGAFSEQFQPLLTQQRQRGIEDISQRFAAAFPGTVGAQGPEFGTLSRFITDEALPREQAFLGQLGLEGLNAQERAAGKLLDTRPGSSLGEQLGQLGTLLALGPSLTGGRGGQIGGDGASLFPGGPGTQGQGTSDIVGQIGNQAVSSLMKQLGFNPSQVGTMTNPAQLFTGGQALQQGLGLVPGAAEGAFATLSPEAGAAFTQGVSQALGGAQVGAFEQLANGGVAILDQSGATIGTINAQGQIVNASGQTVTSSFGATLGTALGGVGVAVGGFQTGRAVTGFLEKRNIGQGSTAKEIATGAASGAAMGAAIGSFIPGIGTVLGAVIGAIAGGFGGAGAEKRREGAQKEREAQQTDAARPQVLQTVGDAVTQLQGLLPQVQALAQRTGTGATPIRTSEAGVTTLNALEGNIRDFIDKATNWINTGGPGQQALINTQEVGHLETGMQNILNGLAQRQQLIREALQQLGAA